MATLVLLPGMDGTGLLLADFVAALGNDIDAQVVRYPSHKVCDYTALEAMVRSHLPQDRPFVLLGESFSGPIAISIAAAPPENMRGVILNCTFARIPVWRGFAAIVRLIPALRYPVSALVGQLLLGRFTSSELMSKLRQAIAQVAPAVRKARLCAILDVDVNDRLAQIRMPVLILYGSEDRLIPARATHAMAERVPHALVKEFAAPHGLLQSVPTDVAPVVKQFIAQCEKQGPSRFPEEGLHASTKRDNP